MLEYLPEILTLLAGVGIGIGYRYFTFNPRASATVEAALAEQKREFDEWNEQENTTLLAEAAAEASVREAENVKDALIEQRQKFDAWNKLENTALLAEADVEIARLSGNKDELEKALVTLQDRHKEARIASQAAIDFANSQARDELAAANERAVESVAAARKDAATRSKRVITGQMAEHFVPYLPGFIWNPKDASFLGAPLDFIIYDGLTEDKDEINIIIAEVKTNNSRLSKRQRKCIEAIEAGRVSFTQITRELDIPEVD